MIVPRIPPCDLFLGFRIEKDYLLREEKEQVKCLKVVSGIFFEGNFKDHQLISQLLIALGTQLQRKHGRRSCGTCMLHSVPKTTLTFALESHPGLIHFCVRWPIGVTFNFFAKWGK